MPPESIRRLLRLVAAAVAVVLVLGGCGRGDGAPPPTVPQAHNDTDVVRTTSGVVRGLMAPDHRLFAGIPYAAPPVGALRWQPPVPPPAWDGVRDATASGPRCVQDTVSDPDYGRKAGEDCLSLNVWTPRTSTDEPRPVMVWIHGGGFANGSGDIYNARWLAAQGDIIVVTINYRLGALGFLAHPALGAEGQVGNYGFEDQQAALRWVRDNIAAFGGDPREVTVAGESAGGMSVCDHLVAPGSAGLFRAAIIMSGPCGAQADLATAQRASVDYAKSVGCADPATAAACLRGLPFQALEKVPWFVQFGSDRLTGPVTGTPVLPVDPANAMTAGRDIGVPLLIGTTADEFTLFVALQYLRADERYTAADYPGLLTETFGQHADAVAAHYPPQRYEGGVASAYAAAVTDAVFACVADRMADGVSHTGPVYAYEFADPAPPMPEPLKTVPFPVGSSHSLELRYLFDIGGAPPLDPKQQQLSDQMVKYWSSFVATGVPVDAGQPDWPVVGTDERTGPRMSLRPDGSRVISTFEAAHQCAFWASSGYR